MGKGSNTTGERSGKRGIYHAACLLLAVVLSPHASAQVAAGTTISNVARVNFQVAGTARTIVSNAISLTVGERLDVTLTLARPVAIESGPIAVVAVTLTNTGNGTEAFDVTGILAPGGAAVGALAIDADGDGRLGPGDTALPNGRTPVLAPGQSLPLVVIADAGASNQAVTIAAAAATGNGAPGTAFAGRGDGGGDAVTGTTSARATLSVPLTGADAPAVTLQKQQSVVAPGGGTTPVRGATITYTLTARFDGAVRAAVVADPIPAGTSYVPGSLRLDGIALTDAADADAGALGGGEVQVTLGDVAQPVRRTISFQVTIQ